MSLLKAEDVVVSGGGTPASGATKAVEKWTSDRVFPDRQIVEFNGSMYVASGSVGANVVPPVEYAQPATPGQPRWILAARGRSLPVVYDPDKVYYADQVVTYHGGTFILDAPTVPAGTRPGRDKRWTRLSETLTEAEDARLQQSNVANIMPGVQLSLLNSNVNETPRVRHHWLRVNQPGPNNLQPGPLYTLNFPRPMRGGRPEILIQPTDLPSLALFLVFKAVVSGDEVTGYTAESVNGVQTGTYDFCVMVKEEIDQILVS